MVVPGAIRYNAAPMTDVARSSHESATLARQPRVPPGRLGVLSLMGAASGVIPLPFVPSRVQYRIRGAIVHDVAERHGLVVTPEARQVLAEPDSSDPQRARIRSFANYVAGRVLRRLGPVWVLTPALAAIETYALGHLLDRYLDSTRTRTSVRIHPSEAHVIRRMLDRTLIRALSPDLPVSKEAHSDAPGEDLREDFTRLTDGVLLFTASIPAWMVRRLEGAFDAIAAETPDLHES